MWPLVFMRQTNSLHIQKMFFFLQSDHPYSSVGIEIVTYPTLPLHIIAKYFVFQWCWGHQWLRSSFLELSHSSHLCHRRLTDHQRLPGAFDISIKIWKHQQSHQYCCLHHFHFCFLSSFGCFGKRSAQHPRREGAAIIADVALFAAPPPDNKCEFVCENTNFLPQKSAPASRRIPPVFAQIWCSAHTWTMAQLHMLLLHVPSSS